ncbi:MAG: hypothetical protein KAQ94_04030 [Arcobacteraceae bacterium]|nr:hypothetical protein [Arcobacteraceae bacterium]
MKKTFKMGGLLIALTLIFTGCPRYDAAIYNSPNNPVIAKKSSANDIYKAIKTAGTSLGWKMTKIQDGEIQGKLSLRGHVAIVKIVYDNTKYSINYASSINLKYDAEKNTIHSNYNGWIQNLENAINVQIEMLDE